MDELRVKKNLKDGTPVLIRTLHPDDKEALNYGFSLLSDSSKYNRFMCSLSSLTDSQLDYLTNLDYSSHFALCVHDLRREYPHGAGIARYIKLKDEPATAEIAITILDEYQRKGLGSILFDMLKNTAKNNGINKFVGYAFKDNKATILMFEKRGAKKYNEDGSVIRFELDI